WIRSHLPMRERPGMFLRLATSYRSWRVRSSRVRPGLPPRARDFAAWRLRSCRTAFGSLLMVRVRFAADCARLMLRRAACVCFVVATSIHLLSRCLPTEPTRWAGRLRRVAPGAVVDAPHGVHRVGVLGALVVAV